MRSLVSESLTTYDDVSFKKTKTQIKFFLIPLILPSVNAADNKQRDKSMSCIKVNIDVWVNFNTVWLIKLSVPPSPFACMLFVSPISFLCNTEVYDELCFSFQRKQHHQCME